jgi:UDP-3-O-[3-hydroxymyristoyl] glucosamine N-acyltransferase
MQVTLAQLCETLRKHGLEPELIGAPHQVIHSVNTLEDAGDGQISFLSNPKYEKLLAETRASAVVLQPDVAAPEHLALLRVANPYAAITALIVELHGYRQHHRPAPAPNCTHIAQSARIGENAAIHPGVTIEDDAVIGDDAVIYPGCYVGPRCRIGNELLLYPNVVVYDDTVMGERWIKIPQIGHVEIGNDVDIGACCTIDRATLGKTKIGSGTKFSNLIAIGHGTQIGENCLLVAQVGLAGSVTVGTHVTMAGQAGVVGHIRIGDNATIGAKAGVTNSVPPGETVLGAPAIHPAPAGAEAAGEAVAETARGTGSQTERRDPSRLTGRRAGGCLL